MMSSINRHARSLNATLVSNKRIGQYHQLLLNIGELVTYCRPGNFVAIAVGGENSGLILQRAFAISRTSPRSNYGGDPGGTIELIIAPQGAGSRWLCSQAEGIELDIIAPLGSAFGIPTEPVQALLIGGGYGSAPLFGLAEVLKSRGCQVDMILGASSAAKIYAPTEGKRSVNSLKIYTEDGSAGILGKVTDPLAGLINEVDVIYSCGPMGMLSAISSIAGISGVVHQCAVEESMACGIGVCMTCVLPVESTDGTVSMLRSCIEGPVMDGSSVRWDLVGKVSN